MAKDQLGHGSNKGTGAQGMRLVKTHVNGPHSAKVYKNPEWEENVVKFFRNGAYQSKADYHTNDISDAHDTAKSALQRYADQDARSRPVGDKAAASALGTSGAAPVHDSMAGVGPNDPRVGSRDYDAFGRPRTDKSGYDEYSRDLALRGRNGQIGSGMKFRG